MDFIDELNLNNSFSNINHEKLSDMQSKTLEVPITKMS